MLRLDTSIHACQSNIHLWEAIPAEVVFTYHANGRLYLCLRCASRKWSTMQKEGARAYFLSDEHTEITHKTELKEQK